MDVVESVKTLGSVAGLITFLFTVWDRILASRPIVHFDFAVTSGHFVKQICLRIENCSADEIIIEDIVFDRPGILYFVGDDVEEVVRIFTDRPRPAFIQQRETRLVSLGLNDFLDDEADLSLVARVIWRKRGSHFLRGIPVRVSTTSGELKELMRDRGGYGVES